jgi:hypothetical protein
MPDLVALIDSNFANMINYYRTFSCDATWVGHIQIQPSDVHPFAYTSFEALLVQLRNYLRAGKNRFLIGTHGYPEQLPYPIIAGTDVAADVEFLNAVGGAAKGDEKQREKILTWQSATTNQNVFANGARLQQFIDVLREVRGNRIQHLEIRGCNMGAGGALGALHDCLNSIYTVAPTVTFMSGMLRTQMQNRTEAQVRTAVTNMAPEVRTYTRTDCVMPFSPSSGSDSLALGMRWTETSVHPHRFSSEVHALSMEAVRGWTKTALENSFYYPSGGLPPGGGYRPLGAILPIIAMWTPGDPKPYVFPGDGFDYLGKLATKFAP